MWRQPKLNHNLITFNGYECFSKQYFEKKSEIRYYKYGFLFLIYRHNNVVIYKILKTI